MTSITTIKEDKLLRKRKTKNLDLSGTNAQEKARATAKDGRKGYSKKSGKASSQRRRRQGNEQANGAKKQREGTRRQAFKLADLLTDEEIKRLKAIK